MKVLHTIPSVAPTHGGPSVAIEAMERALVEAGMSVTTLTTDDDGPGRRLELSGLRRPIGGATRVYFRKRLEFYKIAPGMVPWLWRNVGSFDLVHIHGLFSFTSEAAAMIARMQGVPYLVRPLGSLTAYGVRHRRPWLKRLSLAVLDGRVIRHAAAIHCTSQMELSQANALGIPLRGRIIPLGVEPVAATLDNARCLPSTAGRRLQVLSMSRLDAKKNVQGLLLAFAALLASGTEAELHVAGAGAPVYVAELKGLAQSLGIAGNVVWLGHVDGPRKAATLAGADIFVLASYSENFGIAAVEALFAGLPCILGQGVGIAQAIDAAGAGIMVAPEPDAIAQAIGRLASDPGLRRTMGERGRAFALRAYSTDAMAAGLLTLYREIVANKMSRAA